MEPMWRWAPAVCLAVFASVGVVWRSARQRRRTGSYGIALFRSNGVLSNVGDALLLLLGSAMGLLAALTAIDGALLDALGTPPAHVLVWLRPAGVFLMLVATVIMVLSQLDLGDSWRIGIDRGARPGLVTSGLYRWSRNPIFVSLGAAIAGFAMLVPCVLTAVLLVAAWTGIRLQVRHEEAYLLETYGDEYRAYASRVGRFLPGLGRI